jgi:hypothetical protein
MNSNSMNVENYALLTGFRTSFDMALQAAWCNNCKCGACQPDPDEPGPAGVPAGAENYEFPPALDSVSACNPPMQSGPFPKQLIKFGAMQKTPMM